MKHQWINNNGTHISTSKLPLTVLIQNMLLCFQQQSGFQIKRDLACGCNPVFNWGGRHIFLNKYEESCAEDNLIFRLLCPKPSGWFLEIPRKCLQKNCSMQGQNPTPFKRKSTRAHLLFREIAISSIKVHM